MTLHQMKGESTAHYWQRKVDRAIDYWESAGRTPGLGAALSFTCTREDMPFAFEFNGELHYRGWVLRAAPKVKQRKRRDVQQDIEGA